MYHPCWQSRSTPHGESLGACAHRLPQPVEPLLSPVYLTSVQEATKAYLLGVLEKVNFSTADQHRVIVTMIQQRLKAVGKMALILLISFIVNGGPVLYETRYFLATMSLLLLVYTAYNPTAFFPNIE